MNKKILLLSFFLFITVTAFVFLYHSHTKTLLEDKLSPQASVQEELDKKETVIPEDISLIHKMFFVGDIMLSRGVEHMVRTEGNNDWNFPLKLISEYLSSADILFGNLESMISDKGHNVGSIYSFRADPSSIDLLVNSGFNIVSVANNHSMDYTAKAFSDCLERLQNNEIKYVGGGNTKEESHSPTFINLSNGTEIAFLGYTSVGSPAWQAQENYPGISWLDLERIDILKEDIKKAQRADIVVVSFHFGDEYEKEPNFNQRVLGEVAIDFGADLVVGHHPHVLQPLEKYGNGWIAWSLGNFIFDQYFSEETMTGAILEVEIKEKNIVDVSLTKTKQNAFYQVELK